MKRAADAAGIYLGLNSGFRTMAEQQYLYGCYLSGRCNGGNLAARPGYSNHQSGTAVDVTTSGRLAANASRFGFVRTVPSEAWHYELEGWLKAAARVVYSADRFTLGESSDATQDFALRYTFLSLGDRSLSATAYDASGAELGRTTIQVRILK